MSYFRFRSTAKAGPMVQLPLLMSGFLFIDFNLNEVGLGLIIGEQKIWHGRVECKAKSVYDEWNQVTLIIQDNRNVVKIINRIKFLTKIF